MKKKYNVIKYFFINGYFDRIWYQNTTYGERIVQYLETHTNSEIFELLKKYKKNKYPEFWTYDSNIHRGYERLYLADFSLVELLYNKYKMTDGIGIFEAIRSGRLDVLKFGHLNNFPYDKESCLDFVTKIAIKQKQKNQEYYDWCYKSRCNPNPYYGDDVVKKTETEILDYVVNNM
ncbi:hypothetical protein BMW23_0954 [Bodo saltans virus]|uniref:Uncharacterized protein n=1 Tax=Bodo saltans virus TaxID=2024608 RepID=A0A2H4UWD7_9VIRU|nr:hypothetical protein QJ851_gp0936 [Bodo saltans virus]ATZ80999.1 hypothetical protein BMW23_0954 [Bodo saltans virus]